MLESKKQKIEVTVGIIGLLVAVIALYFQINPVIPSSNPSRPEHVANAIDLYKHMKHDGILKINLPSPYGANNSVKYVITNDAQFGEISNFSSDTGYLAYHPNDGYIGKDEFSYKVFSGNKSSDEGHVNIIVEKPNKPPIANNIVLNAYSRTDSQILLDGKDPDNDVDLYYQIVSSPKHGVISSINQGRVYYTPDNNYYGSDSFGYIAKDQYTQSEVGNISISINGDVTNDINVMNQMLQGSWDYSLISFPKAGIFYFSQNPMGQQFEYIGLKNIVPFTTTQIRGIYTITNGGIQLLGQDTYGNNYYSFFKVNYINPTIIQATTITPLFDTAGMNVDVTFNRIS